MPASVSKLDAFPAGDQEGKGSIPAVSSNIISWHEISWYWWLVSIFYDTNIIPFYYSIYKGKYCFKQYIRLYSISISTACNWITNWYEMQ